MRCGWILLVWALLVLGLEAQPPEKKIVDVFQSGEAIDLGQAIPSNERGILCLATDDQGRVYGGTTGRAAHLFVYDPETKDVRSLVRLAGGIGFSYALIRLPDGSLIGGTQADPTGIAMKTDEKEVGWLYRFVVGKDGKATAEKLGKPVAGQGIYTLAYDKTTETICGNTFPDGHFFTYELKTKKFTDHGAIAGYRPFETPQHAADLNKGVKKKTTYTRQVSRAIFLYEGAAYTGGKDGYLFRYDFKTNKIQKTNFRLPAARGREAWASLDIGIKTSGDTIICGTSEGYLFYFGKSIPHAHTFKVDSPPQLKNIGRPSAQGNFHGLVHLKNYGKPLPPGIGDTGLSLENFHDFTGVVGHKDGMPRGFKFTGDHCSLEGIPHADGQASMVGFGAMIKDNKGNVYAGEQDRIARLIRYPSTEGAKAAPQKKKLAKVVPQVLGGPSPEENLVKLKGKVIFAPEGTTTDGSAYTAIEVGLDGNVYVGTARYGGYAWLLRFDPGTNNYFMERIVNMQALCGERLVGINTQGKIHAIILVGPDGRIWFATKQAHEIFDTRPEYGEDPNGYPGGHLCYYDPKTGFSRSVGILKKQEGLMAGAIDNKLNKLYYRTEPKNHFLVYDIQTGDVEDRGHVGNNCRYFAMDKDGAVYSPGRGNYLTRYDPKTGYVEDLSIKIDGEGTYAAPYVIALGANGKLYGAGISHPWIMEFDIASYKKGLFPEVTMRNVAPAAPQGMPVQDIHAGVFGKDNKFYYPLVTNGPVEKGGKAVKHLRIMRFDPQTKKTETVGVPDTSGLDESKVKHTYVRGEKYSLDHIQGAKVSEDGTLFLMDIYPQLNVVQFPKLTAPK